MIPMVEIEEIDKMVFMPAESLTERFQNLELHNKFYRKLDAVFLRNRIIYEITEDEIPESKIGHKVILVHNTDLPLVIFEKPIRHLFFINTENKQEQQIIDFLTNP